MNLHIYSAYSIESFFLTVPERKFTAIWSSSRVSWLILESCFCPSFWACCCVCVYLQAKGFELSYLEKVPEVKDTVHKQSLLHHACTIVVDKFPDSTDLYSEIGAITRLTKVWIIHYFKNLLSCFCTVSVCYIHRHIHKRNSPTICFVVRWTLTSFKTIWPRWSEGAKHHGITSRSLRNMRWNQYWNKRCQTS